MERAGRRGALGLGGALVGALVVVFPLGPRFALPVGNIYLGTMLTLAWLAGWFILVFAGPGGGLSLATAPQKAVFLYALFLVVQVVAHLGSLLENPSMLLRAVQLVAYMGLFVTISSMRPSARLPRLAMRLSFLALAAECAIAWIPSTQGPRGEHIGTFDYEHNSFGAFLLLTLCLLVGVFVAGPPRRWRVWTVILTAAALVALAFSLSRTVYIAFPVALLALVHRRWKLRGLLVAGLTSAAIAGLAASVLPLGVVERASTIVGIATGEHRDISFTTRLVLWGNALDDLARTGFLGVGIYHYMTLDSYFIRALVETGPLGLLLYLWVLVAVLAWLWRAYDRETDPELRALAIGLYGATVGLLIVMNLSMDTLLLHRVMGVYWVLLGALVASRRSPGASPRSTDGAAPAGVSG